jgi:hypothetical protein
MLKRELIDKMWADIRENADEEVNARDPEVGGLLDHEEFKHALECVNWTDYSSGGVQTCVIVLHLKVLICQLLSSL